jgi:folate-binding protein YgfZ
MDSADFENKVAGAAVLLAGRATLMLSGADRVRYLNGQSTNDARLATPTRSIYSLVTDHKGHVLGDFWVHASPDGSSLLLDAEPELQEPLAVRLERYIVSDDATLEDVTGQWDIWHYLGSAAEAMESVPGAIHADRLGQPGIDIWVPAGEVPPSWAGPLLTLAEYETLRVIAGVPRYPAELGGGSVFPSEARLETRAVSFTKGCYIGQEVISRIQSTGKMPRQLMRWTAQDAAATVLPGMTLHLPDSPEKSIGTVTSATTHPVGQKAVGLAYVKQGAVKADSTLLACGAPPTIRPAVSLTVHVP